MGQLQLERPLVFFDLETTGLRITSNRIVEIAMLKINPDGSEEKFYSLVNPEQKIPKYTSEIHGITDEMVQDKPTFEELAPSIAKFLENCDLAGFNLSGFDVPLLAEEFHRTEVPIDLKRGRNIIDAQVIFHKKEKRTLAAAYDFYCGKELTEAHSAGADTRASYEVLLGQLERYDDLPRDAEGLGQFSKLRDSVDLANRFVYDDQGREVFNFGKYRGTLVEDVVRQNPSYVDWMMSSDFPIDTKRELLRVQMRVEASENGGAHE